jgi:lipid-A-disaccharide synthase-like uncharacterized protein
MTGPSAEHPHNLVYDAQRRVYSVAPGQRGSLEIDINSPYVFEQLLVRLTFGDSAIANRVSVTNGSGRHVQVMAGKIPKAYYLDVSRGFRGRRNGTIELAFSNDSPDTLDVLYMPCVLAGRFYAAHQLIPGLLYLVTIPCIVFWLAQRLNERRVIINAVWALGALAGGRLLLHAWFGTAILIAPWIYGIVLACSALTLALRAPNARQNLIWGTGAFIAASMLYHGLALRLVPAQKFFVKPGMVGSDTISFFARMNDSYAHFFAPAEREPLFPFLLKAVYSIFHFPNSEINYTSVCTVFLAVIAGVVIYRLGTRLFGPIPALIAVTIFVFDRVEIQTMAPMALREQLTFILVIGYLGALFATGRLDTIRRSVLAGIYAGLLILCRVGMMYTIILMSLYLAVLRSRTHRLRYVAMQAAVAFLIAFPYLHHGFQDPRNPALKSVGDVAAVFTRNYEFPGEYGVPSLKEYDQNHLAGPPLTIFSYMFDWHSPRDIFLYCVEPLYRSLFLTSGMVDPRGWGFFHAATLAAILLPLGLVATLVVMPYRWLIVSFLALMAPLAFVTHVLPFTRYLYMGFPVLCLICAVPAFLAGEYARRGREGLMSLVSVSHPVTLACVAAAFAFVVFGISQYDSLRAGLEPAFNRRLGEGHNLFDVAIPRFPVARTFDPPEEIKANREATFPVVLARGRNRLEVICDFSGQTPVLDVQPQDRRLTVEKLTPEAHYYHRRITLEEAARLLSPDQPQSQAFLFIVEAPHLGSYRLTIKNRSPSPIRVRELRVQPESQ